MYCSEVDQSLLRKNAEWCVYLHKRPDGSTFYVGKGRRHRPYDFAQSRRNEHHRNITAKYGKQNIQVDVIPCEGEFFAFQLEKAHIKIARMQGFDLANYTDGGEGAARAPTEKQIEGLNRGRQKRWDAWRAIGGQSQVAIRKAQAWRVAVCADCNRAFDTKRFNAKCCSRKCEQRHRRARHGA